MDGQSSQLYLTPERPSHSGASEVNINAPAIFLSHSGKQKPFVEHLFNALKHANHTKHTAFFDKHTLPKGSPFPDHIREAALSCMLGVVVLSDDFFTSKWPMIELEILVLQKGPHAKVFPVCYKLNFEDLKSPKNISKWRSKWEEIEGGKHVEQWGKAVQALARFNGEIYTPRSSETTYIEKVVHHICGLVPCPVPYDTSLIQGHQRLAEEIASMFDGVKASCPEKSLCMVGLHGVAGLGKTTLCQSMVNHYTSQYLGRSCLIELPSNGDKSVIRKECKRALKKLANFSDDLHLDEVNSFEQVVRLMMDHVKRYDVFLAIDNVWDNSVEETRRLLRVGFSATSKILLTSRSEQLLKRLFKPLQPTTKCRVDPLPTLQHEEAFQIFQEMFDPGNCNSLLDSRDQIDKLLRQRCKLDGIYHPLALRALARHTYKSVWVMEDVLENRQHSLSDILEDISKEDLQNVEDVIKYSYDNLPLIKKHIFLDIAVFFASRLDFPVYKKMDGEKISSILRWLCRFYTELNDRRIAIHIDELALDGLIQIKTGKDGSGKRIKVHDLYSELAHEEAASDCRFLVRGSIHSGNEIEWESLERVLLVNQDVCFFEKARNSKCEKLRVVELNDVNMMSEIPLHCMPSLRVLLLKRVDLINCEKQRTSRIRMRHGVNLVWEKQRASRIRMGWAAAPERVWNLNTLDELQALFVESCDPVGSITGLEALRNLRHLEVRRCPRVKKLEGLSGMYRLEELHVAECPRLKTICAKPKEGSFWSLSPFLQRIRISDCGALEKMPDVGGLTGLESLVLENNEALDVEVGGKYLSSTLRVLQISRVKSVRTFPSLNECVNLETLFASQGIINDSLLPEKLPNLRTLQLLDCSCTSDLFNEQWKHGSTLLQHLTFVGCESIEKLEVGCFMISLKALKVWFCSALEEIGDLSALHCLEELHIQGSSLSQATSSAWSWQGVDLWMKVV